MILLAMLFLLSTTDPAASPHIKAAQSAFQAGKLALSKNQPAVAAEFLTKAIEIEPTFLDAYKSLIDAQLAAGEDLKAAATITQFLEITPEANRYRLRLGQILLGQKQWNRALAQFSLVLRQEPFDADALWGFANAADKLGMKDRAYDALAKGRSHFPHDKRFGTP